MKYLNSYRAPVLKNYYLPHGYELKKRKHSLAENRLFEIQTLSDNIRLADPISVILGIGTIIPSLFPNLFGSEKTSKEVFDKLFPSNGYWTSQYKNWLLSKIKYIKDIERDLHMYTGQFIEMNQSQICAGEGGQDCWSAFYELLKIEERGGGIQPPPGLNYQTLLLVGGGVLLLLALTKKKSRSKK